MRKAKELSKDLREKVVELYKSGKGYKKVLKVPVSSVQTLITKWKSRGSVDTKPWLGRPISAEIQASLQKHGVSVSRCTIRRYLNKNGLHGQISRKKLLLCQCHKTVHLQYAKQHLDKPQNFWNKVIWSDETNIELYGHNYRHYEWYISYSF